MVAPFICISLMRTAWPVFALCRIEGGVALNGIVMAGHLRAGMGASWIVGSGPGVDRLHHAFAVGQSHAGVVCSMRARLGFYSSAGLSDGRSGGREG